MHLTEFTAAFFTGFFQKRLAAIVRGRNLMVKQDFTFRFLTAAARFLHLNRRSGFLALWFLTILLGGIFLLGTAREWHRLIYERGLTISTNLFGTTYYSLVGLHATHVVVGLIMLTIVFLFGVAGRVGHEQSGRVEVLALYWHFVDAVWVVVFSAVYLIAR